MGTFVRILGTLACLLLVTQEATAQYPAKPIHFIVPFPAGGPGDTFARVIAQPLSKALGQPVVVENRPGADGTIGAAEVARAAPDGYMLLYGGANSLSAVVALRKNPPYDPIANFTPITSLGNTTFVLVSHTSIPGNTLADLIDYAGKNSGKLNFAAANPPSLIVAAKLRSLAKAEITNVPYKGDASAMPDLLSGRVQLLVAGANVVRPYIKNGKLNGLATLLESRSPLIPEVPTATEAGLSDLPLSFWSGVLGPAQMPKEIVEKLSYEINTILGRPDIRARLEKLGFEVRGSTPEALASLMKEQIRTWRRLGSEAGIQPE
jgi:putative tricarboxylic transport membrane protein